MLIEYPEIDGKIRRMLRNKISKQLPYRLIEDEKVKRKILSEFQVINNKEWHEKYSEYMIR